MSSTFNHDKELAEFFTDVEPLRDAFKEMVAACRGGVIPPTQGEAIRQVGDGRGSGIRDGVIPPTHREQGGSDWTLK